MQGDAKVIEYLNKGLRSELTAINQYWLHYRMLDNWGVARLAEFERHESIDEMKHADMLMDRIFMLDGLPNLQDLGKLMIGEDVPEMLACDLGLERGAQATVKEGMAHCESVRDYVSRFGRLKLRRAHRDHAAKPMPNQCNLAKTKVIHEIAQHGDIFRERKDTLMPIRFAKAPKVECIRPMPIRDGIHRR